MFFLPAVFVLPAAFPHSPLGDLSPGHLSAVSAEEALRANPQFSLLAFFTVLELLTSQIRARFSE